MCNAIAVISLVVFLVILLESVDSDLDSRYGDVLRDLRHSGDRALRSIHALRSLCNDRGVTIATTQAAVEKWKRRAADKTFEVHRLQRLLKAHGIDYRGNT